MDLGIEGKVALITASGRGLGRAIAQSLIREGARVIINSRTKSDLEGLLAETDSLNRNHLIYCADLFTPNGPKELVDYLKVNNVIPDIVVHNLGGNLNITDPLCSMEEWKSVSRYNLEIPVEINREIIPFMQKKKWGRICHVSSISGLENQGAPSYSVAKAGLVAYARSVGRFVAKDGIVINAVLPGAVFTEGGYWDETSKKRPEHVEKYLKERMAIQRFGKPKEISEVVTFLCSELASFCIGSSFLVDGGQGKVFFMQE